MNELYAIHPLLPGVPPLGSTMYGRPGITTSYKKVLICTYLGKNPTVQVIIVTPFMDVLFGVIHTRTLLENLLSVLVTHSSVL